MALLFWYIFYQGVYKLQILHVHTASLVGQDYEKIIAMGVQLTYIMIQLTNSEKTRIFHKYQLYGIEDYTVIFECTNSRICT